MGSESGIVTLPDVVRERLRQDVVDRARPFCFLIDDNLRLCGTWGDAAWCGMQGLEEGAAMADRAPFLIGADLSELRRMDFVSLGRQAIAHIYLIPAAAGLYVVLLDAMQDHAVLQPKQQSVNELRLLKLEQDRLIGRQRELISELVEAKAELDHHRREAERSSAAKSRFIAMMSHEFRTPLASIINYSDLGLEPDVDQNHVRKSLEAIGRSGRHLTSIVEAVLDEARLDAGQITLRERDFDLHDLVRDLSAIMAPLAGEKALAFAASIQPDVPSRIRADDVCLRQILVNLLGNAVKFTESGSVRIEFAFQDGQLLATVTDTGPGIDPDDQEAVFRAFERAGHVEETGAGLGLTISLRLAGLMGGEVSLDSSPGMGSTVRVQVPVMSAVDAVQEDAALPIPAAENLASRPASVLVCDDDEDMIALVDFYLHRAGYGLITAADGNEAVEKAIAYQPDLVLMDVNVRGMNGIDAAHALRRRGFSNPIVALTAATMSASDADIFSLCFRKPAPMQELLAEIKRLTHAG